jgi:hypothetical protein
MSDANTNVARIPRDTKARHEGYLAGRRGLTGADNPYLGDSRAAQDWLMGLRAPHSSSSLLPSANVCEWSN